MTENYYMEIQEKLSRLFDGELDESQAQGILNEVAKNSKLQALYNEQKALHSYLQNPYLPETIGLKDDILTKIKLDSASIRKYKTKKYILRSAMVGLFLLTLGGSYLLLNNNGFSDKKLDEGTITTTVDYKNYDVNEKNKNNAVKKQIPVVTQTNLDSKGTGTLEEKKYSASGKSKIITSSKKGYLARNSINDKSSNSNYSSELTNLMKSELPLNKTTVMETEQPQRNILSYSNLFADTKVSRDQNVPLPKNYLNPVYNYKTELILDRLSLQFNWYGISDSKPNFKPINSKTGLINDFSLFLMYELTEKTSVGLSLGYDNFLMQYEGWEGNTKFRYSQEYSTPWIGCNIKHRFEPIFSFADYYEVSPYVQLNTAYANVGIYTQASTGIELGISDNTSLLVGFNSGWLFYKYENYEFTNKNGLNIGLKYGF